MTSHRFHLRRRAGIATFACILAASATAVVAGVDAPAAHAATIGTTVTMTTSRNPAYSAQSGAITVRVRKSSATQLVPTGVVDFFDPDDIWIWSATLDATGRARVPYSDLGAGTWTLTAVYSGDASFSASTSAPLTQVILPTAPDTTVTATPTTVPVNGTTRVVVAAHNATPIGMPSTGIGVLLPAGARIVSSPAGVGCRRAWPNLYYCLTSLPSGATKRIVLDVTAPALPTTIVVSGYSTNAVTGEGTSGSVTIDVV